MLFILFLALAVRLYGVTLPALDWHAFRQADTLSVTRHYAQHGINLLEPKYDDLGNIASGLDNPQGFRMVEFPLINALIALVQKISHVDVTLLSRVFSIAASLVTIALVYVLVKKISGETIAKVSALVLAILPYNVYYSRVILPEPYLVLGVVGGLTAWWLYLQEKKLYYLVATIVSLAFALLMKPFAIFIYPALAAMAWLAWKWGAVKRWELYTLGLPVLPLLAWRQWITNFPEGIPSSDWLLNGDGIRLKPSWFKWIFFERIGRLMLGWTGVLAATASLLKLNREEQWIYGSWWLGMVLYVVTIATGNVRHDYYQALLAPIIAITVGKGLVELYRGLRQGLSSKQLWWLTGGVGLFIVYGLSFVLELQGSGFYPERIGPEWRISTLISGLLIGYFWLNRAKKLPAQLAKSLVLVLFASSLVFSWRYVQEYYKVHHWEYMQIGQAVQAILPANAKVIAPADGDTMFLYQLNRPGWALGTDIEEKIAQGATHYISPNFDNVTQDLAARFTVISQTEQYTLIDVTQPK